MTPQNQKNLTQALRRLASHVPEAESLGSSHEQRLRRALLNSRHFSAGPLKQFWRSFHFGGLTVRLALGSVTLGVALAILVAPVADPSRGELTTSFTKTSDAQSVLKNLNSNGQMRYAGEDKRGSSIYTVEMNGQIYEIHDDYAQIQKTISR